ncbi:DEAD/DEAH box helicase [Polyangium spumosum]
MTFPVSGRPVAAPVEAPRATGNAPIVPVSMGGEAPGAAFAALGLAAPLVRALVKEGYEHPTPIQSQSIPEALSGRDLLGCAQTGTGKTAAFVLPILQRLSKTQRHGGIRALVLTPTRELAAQIGERVTAYGRHLGLRHVVIYGGVGQRPQEENLAKGPDLLVATPGRLLDLMQQGFVRLDRVEVFVLDEADRMLDMGFIHDVRRVVAALPKQKQTLFFSATMPREIAALADNILVDPARVSVTPARAAADTVEQSIFFVEKADKRALLERLLRASSVERALVFTRTKHGANRISEQLVRAGIEALAIHGNKSQGARERALDRFRRGVTPVLVATDIAARGIDVEGVSHVINYDLPNVPESYVHRIGRTGRAGATGSAISFCDREERALLSDIEKLLRRRIPVAEGQAPPADAPPAPAPRAETRRAFAPEDRRRGPRPSQGHAPRGRRS